MSEPDTPAPLDPRDLESWAAFLPTVRVGGSLPVTFRHEGDYVVVEVVVPYVAPSPAAQVAAWVDTEAAAPGPRKIPISIADGFPVPLAARFRLPAFSEATAARFLRDIVRQIYRHEIDEQLRVGDDRPFAPEHG